MDVDSRLFPGEEEQPELPVADDGRGHGGTLADEVSGLPDVRAGRNPGGLPSALHPRRPIRASKHALQAENQESTEDVSSEDQEVAWVRP